MSDHERVLNFCGHERGGRHFQICQKGGPEVTHRRNHFSHCSNTSGCEVAGTCIGLLDLDAREEGHSLKRRVSAF